MLLLSQAIKTWQRQLETKFADVSMLVSNFITMNLVPNSTNSSFYYIAIYKTCPNHLYLITFSAS